MEPVSDQNVVRYGFGRALVWRRSDGLVAEWRFDASLTSPTTTFLTGVPLSWSLARQ
jgi:hypothetical protein